MAMSLDAREQHGGCGGDLSSGRLIREVHSPKYDRAAIGTGEDDGAPGRTRPIRGIPLSRPRAPTGVLLHVQGRKFAVRPLGLQDKVIEVAKVIAAAPPPSTSGLVEASSSPVPLKSIRLWRPELSHSFTT